MKTITKKSWILIASVAALVTAIGGGWALERVYHPKILTPQEIYEQNVDVVHSIHMDGRYGSAVAIAEDILVTNCHVLGRGRLILVDEQENLIQIINKDFKKIDLCFLYVPGLNFKPATVRDTSDAKIGEKVYAIGNPLGYEKTLSQGIISNKVTSGGSHRLQTDTPISPGSSGGGLFDEYGNLIGITSAGVPGSGNINFAAPTEPINAVLKQYSKLITEQHKKLAAEYKVSRQVLKTKNDAKLQACAKNDNVHCKAYLGFKLFLEKKYELARPLLEDASKYNLEQAHAYLSMIYAKDSNEKKTLEHAESAAYLGDYESAFKLSNYYTHKAKACKNIKQRNEYYVLAYAWLKVSGFMGAITIDQGYEVPVTTILPAAEQYMQILKIYDQGEKAADQICDKVVTCIRYDKQKTHKSLAE